MEKEKLITENTEMKGININKTYVAKVGVYVDYFNGLGKASNTKSEVLDVFLVEPIFKKGKGINNDVVGFREIITGEQVVVRYTPWGCNDDPCEINFEDYDIQAISYEKRSLIFGTRIKYNYKYKVGDLYWDLCTDKLAVKLLDEDEIAKYLEQTPEEIRSKLENLRKNAYDEYINKKHYVKVRKR